MPPRYTLRIRALIVVFVLFVIKSTSLQFNVIFLILKLLGWTVILSVESIEPKITPIDELPKGIEEVKANMIKKILDTADLYRYSGTFEYDGSQFEKSREFFQALYQIRALAPTFSSGIYPIRIAKVGGVYLLNDQAAVMAMTTYMINITNDDNNKLYAELTEVDSLGRMKQLVSHIDSRI